MLINHLLKPIKPYGLSFKLNNSIKRFSTSNKKYSIYKVNQEIEQALNDGKPVIALESTIISHGMPYPQNVECALEVENIIRSEGCIPATIAILDGKVQVGLDKNQLDRLGETGLKARKVSRRDMAYTLSQKLIGATTVASTMIAAHHVGIPIFVTGGIGGVHRGAESSMDISADLTELGRTNVTVICAGAKSILDIGKTLEYLETQGVAVATLGEYANFPSFFTQKSEFMSPIHLKTVEEASKLIELSLKLNLKSGSVIGIPIPDQYESQGLKIESAIQQALLEAKHRNVQGKLVTPFLLDKVNQLTKGISLNSNIALVKNNALIGSRIAKGINYPKRGFSTNTTTKNVKDPKVMVIGGCGVDIIGTSDLPLIKDTLDTSSLGKVRLNLGGVGCNIARVCNKLEVNTKFISSIGNDIFGIYVKDKLSMEGLSLNYLIYPTTSNHSTAIYHALHSKKGQLIGAIADMSIINDLITPSQITKSIQSNPCKVICFDGNLSDLTIESILKTTSTNKSTYYIFEPTSKPKCLKLILGLKNLNKDNLKNLIITPNSFELKVLYQHFTNNKDNENYDLSFDDLIKMIKVVREFLPNLVVKIGSDGALVVSDNEITHLKPDNVIENPVSVSGAGDSLVGYLIASIANLNSLNLDHHTLIQLVKQGMKVSELTLMDHDTVPNTINKSLLI